MRSDELLEAVRLHLHERLGAVDARVASLAEDVQQAVERQATHLAGLVSDLQALVERVEHLSAPVDPGADLLTPVISDIQHLRGQVAGLVQELDGVQEELGKAGLADLTSHVQRLDGALGVVRVDTAKLIQRVEEVREELVEHQSGLGEEQESLVERLDEVTTALTEGLAIRLAQAQKEGERVLADHSALWDAALTALESRTTDRIVRLQEHVERRLEGWEEDLRVAREATQASLRDETRERGEQVSALVEAIAAEKDLTGRCFAQQEKAQDALEQTLDEAFETLSTALQIRLEEASLQRAEHIEQTLEARFDETLSHRMDDLEERIEAGLYRLRGDLLDRYTQAEAWARGGEAYKMLAIVRHRGGLWQATERTSDEPMPECASWMLLVDGIHEVGYEIEEGQAWVLTTRSSGAVHRAPVPYPTFRSRGTYKAGETYRQWDTVVRNRTTFMAAQDTDTEPSNRSGHWIQLSDVVQGPKGPPGRDGRSLGREDLVALLPQITRMLADELEMRQEQRARESAQAASEQARL